MDREALVYVDLDGVPHLMGRLWARTRKNKESATFEYEQDMAGKSCAILSGASPAGWSRPVSHAGRHAHVRRHRRLRAGPLGAGAHAPYGTQARGARGRGAEHAPGNRLSAAGRRRGPSGRAALCGKKRRTLPAGGGRQAHPPADRAPETALRSRTCDGREGYRGGTAPAVRARLVARRRAAQGFRQGKGRPSRHREIPAQGR